MLTFLRDDMKVRNVYHDTDPRLLQQYETAINNIPEPANAANIIKKLQQQSVGLTPPIQARKVSSALRERNIEEFYFSTLDLQELESEEPEVTNFTENGLHFDGMDAPLDVTVPMYVFNDRTSHFEKHLPSAVNTIKLSNVTLGMNHRNAPFDIFRLLLKYKVQFGVLGSSKNADLRETSTP